MAAPPCRFTPERFWTEEKERALIGFFSKHSCLWNQNSEDYKDRQLRWKTLERLRVLLSSQPPPAPFTVEDVKNKFKNLRTTFQRQHRMVRLSQEAGSDHLFEPQWKHYQQLMFLRGSWDQDDVPDEPPPLPPEESRPADASSSLIVSFLPSSSSSAGVMRSHWTEERERTLISFYKEHSCLWSKKSVNYNNRQLRQKLLDSLRTQLSDRLVSFSVEDIKCKFKNLRTVFNRELKSVQASRTSDKPYVSKWKHYHQLLFLCESADEDDSPGDLEVLLVHEGRDQERGSPPPTTGSPQTGGVRLIDLSVVSGHTEGQTGTGAVFQVLLPAAPDHLDPRSSAVQNSPSRSSPDRKPCLVQGDDRLSSELRCLWSDAKVQQLIGFYSEHSCLWNHRLKNYKNRLLRQSLLDKLSGVLSENEPVPFSVEDIKTKFRNLRTIFQREHKVVSSNRTCGSEDFYLPKWKHYQDLLFLCESCEEDEEQDEDFLPTRYSAPNQTDAPPSPTPPDSRRSSPSSSSPSTTTFHTDRRAAERKRASPHRHRRRRRPPPASSGELMELMRSVWQNRSDSPHAGFLKYVEEVLNETPPNKVRKLKRKIIETIHHVTEDF